MVQQMNWGYINFKCQINTLIKRNMVSTKLIILEDNGNFFCQAFVRLFFECSSSVVRVLFDASSMLVRRFFD